ncbi:MAG TPA: right-handed parallel beta-helix repeat-containing protein [Candidatus Nitrosocosmicus sp.]
MKYLHDNGFNVLTFYNLRYNNENSIARNNIINNQETPIEVSASNNNEVYNNAISKSPTAGITVKAGSSGNKIYNNIIDNTQDVGIKISPDSKNNSIYSNKINGVTQQSMDTKSQSDKVKKQSSKSGSDGNSKK